jgi:hypothetical protein
MNKLLLAIAMSLLASISVAQVTIIPKVGLSLCYLATHDDDYWTEFKSKTGVALGVATNVSISKVFSVQPEILYVNKGFRVESTQTTPDAGYSTSHTLKVTDRINYLEIPVLARFTFGSTTKFYFYGGPSVSFGLGGKAKDTYVHTISYDNGPSHTGGGVIEGKIKFGPQPDYYGGNDTYINNRVDVGAKFGSWRDSV